MVVQNLDPVTTQEWARVRGILRSEVGEAAYRSWLKPLKLLSVDDGRVEISVPTQFMRDWVISHYGDRLRQLWISQNSTVKSVEIRVDLGAQSKIIRSIDRDRKQFPARGSGKLAEVVKSSDLCSPLDTRFKFSDYIVGKSNELAYAAARRIADSESAPFNPLFLYGGVGLKNPSDACNCNSYAR